jgi:3-dehydroquinate synthase
MTQKITYKISCLPKYSEVEICSGLLQNISQYLNSMNCTFAIITDERIETLYGKTVHQLLIASSLEAHLFSFPCGEQNKTRFTKELIENKLFEKKLGRDTCVIALGGGVVTDIAGFVAATYCRGIDLIMIPTTLLCMVDACIGGKTGVNVAYGKNMLGCVYQPRKILIDPSVLNSLPSKEIANGVVEMIKHGLVANSTFFEYLERYADQILSLEPEVLKKVIFDSCRIKKEIIEEDANDKGMRNLLNFGHTVGHALESLTNYKISHGEAVAIGLLVESYLSVQLGMLNSNSLDRIKKILAQYHLPLSLPSKYPVTDLLHAMSSDKKSLKGQIRFVLIDEVGSSLKYNSSFCTPVENSLIIKALEWMNNDLCCC